MFSRGIAALILGLMVSGHSSGQVPAWHYLDGGTFEGAASLDTTRAWVSGDSRIHWTGDGGDTWQEVSFENAQTNVSIRVRLRGMFIVEAGSPPEVTGWAVGDGGVVLRTVDGFDGQRWDDLNGPATSGNRIVDVTDEPAVLYDIFMLENTNYAEGWAVGEGGAIARTSDGGVTWTNVADDVDENFFAITGRDAYIVHFFEDPGSGEEFEKGFIAAEYGRVYSTEDAGATWTEEVLPLGAEACPEVDGNLEWWAMEFDDPTDPASAAWLVGGIGTNQGYIYRTSGWQAGTGWADTWEQRNCYDLLNPTAAEGICGLSTQYAAAVLDPAADPTVGVVSVGYQSQVLHHQQGTSDFDPCECAAGSGFCSAGSDTWVQKPVPALDGNPAFRAAARLGSTKAVFAGAFGRMALYDSTDNPPVTDFGTVYNLRLNDVAFIDASTGCVFGQGHDIRYTENGGATWTPAGTTGWDPDGGFQWRGVTFNSSFDVGLAVGDAAFLVRSSGSSVVSSWTKVDVGHIGDLQDVAFAPNSSTAYVVGPSGLVLKSTNDGVTWSQVTAPGSENLHGVAFATPSVGYVVGENRKAYKTVNGGTSWTSLGTGAGDTLLDVVTWDGGSEAILVGQNGTVLWITPSEPRAVALGSQMGFDVTQNLYQVEAFDDGDTLRISGAGGLTLFRDVVASEFVWTRPRSGTTEDLTGMDFLSADEGYAVGGLFAVLRYDD